MLRGLREVRSWQARVGHRTRAALGGESLPPILSGGPLGKSVAEAPLAVSLGVSFHCWAHYMGPRAGSRCLYQEFAREVSV